MGKRYVVQELGEGHPLHLLHAWSVEEGVCLAQVPVSEKSNEISAFYDLIPQLELKGGVVTADAMHTQKKSAAAVIDNKGDYVFPVKGNQSALLEDIDLLFREADAVNFRGIDAVHTETVEKVGERVEIRSYELLSAEGLPEISDWPGCQCVGRVKRKI